MSHSPTFSHSLKNKILLFFILISFVQLNSPQAFAQYPAGSPVAINGKLKVIGSHVTNECGNAVQLRGMATHGPQWFGGCYNTGSLDALTKDWKIDIFRLSMYIQEGGYLNNPSYWRGWIDNMVDECGKRGIYVVIDWHVHLPGDPNSALPDARVFWDYMSKKHVGKKHVIYEICNEPSRVFWGTVQSYANDIIPRIRANDPNTIIVVGSPSWSQDLHIVADDPLMYTNLVYALHFYAGSHGQSLRDKGNYAMSKGIAIMVTEFGTSDAQNTRPMFVDESQVWMDWMNANKISWMNWSFSDKDEPNSALKPGSCGGNWNNVTQSGAWIKSKLISPAKNFGCDPTKPETPTILTPAYTGTPFAVPGKFEAEHYDKGGNTVGYLDKTVGNNTNLFRSNDVDIELTSDPEGGEYNIAWVEPGEWLNYTVTVGAAGKYDINLRYSAESAGTIIHVESNKVNITGPVTVPSTGAWSNWQTLKIPNINLAAGDQVIKIVFDAGSSNLNYINIQPASINGNINPIVSIASPASPITGVSPTAFTFTANAADADGTITKVEYRSGTLLLGQSTVSPYSFTWNNVATGNYSVTATAYDNAGASTVSAQVSVVVKDPFVNPVATPFNGVAINIPGKIEAEEYDKGGLNIGYFDVSGGNAGNIFRFDDVDIETSTDLNGGFSIGWTSAEEWLQYAINVTATDKYDFTFRVSTPYDGKTLQLALNGLDLTTPIVIPNTGGWQTWKDVKVSGIPLEAGLKSLKILFNNGDINFNYVTVSTSSVNPENIAPTVSITSPSNNATFTAPASINLAASANDADGTISKVEYFNGVTLIGQSVVSPYSFSWTGVAAGNYSITAKATDNGGKVTTSSPVAITVTSEVVENQAPTVSLSSPANNATFTAPATISLGATAADADGTISKVEFLNGSTIVGTSLTSPYTATWNNVAAGTYVLTARATDNGGKVTTSAPVTITVNSVVVENQAPTVNITGPANNATFTAPATISLSATAADADGTVSKVEFLNGATIVGTSLTSPYTASWSNVAAGTYVLTARVTDNGGKATTSTSVTITVNSVVVENQAPTVSLTAPTNNATFTAPATISLGATASDADGTVSKVEFLNGATIVGTSLTSPYTATWNNVAAGTYVITARATDNGGKVTTSTSATITVNPQVVVTCPPVAIPPAAQWVVRNDWNDPANGSTVTNSTDALVITHRQWGKNKLWTIQTGKSFNVVKGQTYTIKLDFINDVSNPVSSIDFGFATSANWDGPVLAQPTANNVTGFPGGVATSKTVNILSNFTGTVRLALAMNWPAQVNKVVKLSIKNLAICNASGTALRVGEIEGPSFNVSPNPFEDKTTLKINALENTDLEISVNDISGREVYHSLEHKTNEEFHVGSTFSKGVYVVKAMYNNQITVFSFIKL